MGIIFVRNRRRRARGCPYTKYGLDLPVVGVLPSRSRECIRLSHPRGGRQSDRDTRRAVDEVAPPDFEDKMNRHVINSSHGRAADAF